MPINKNLVGFVFVSLFTLIVVSLLIISYGYFNMKEISLLTSKCYENGGEAILEIHNNITGRYSFECKK